MKCRTTRRFRTAFRKLPKRVQSQARDAYRLFSNNPQHPSLRFKRVHPTEPIYSVRVTRSHRALGVLVADEIVWFWIGDHDAYERLIAER
jgi:hypothetical protein